MTPPPAQRFPSRGLRVALLSWKAPDDPHRGGAEHWLARVADALADAGHQPVWVGPDHPRGGVTRVGTRGVPVVRLGSRLGVFSRAARWVADHAGDLDLVVDTVNVRPFGAHRWSPPSVTVVYQRAVEAWVAAPPPVRVLGRRVLEPTWWRSLRSARVVALSLSTAADLATVGVPVQAVIGIGDDPPAPPPPVGKANRPTLVFCGRLAAPKQPDHVLEIHRLVRDAGWEDLRTWVVGDGPLLGRLWERRPPGVVLCGRVPATTRDRILASAHLMVVTSVREGWCLSVSEAARLGTPSVGYRVPGLIDSVPAGGGWLCEPDPRSAAATVAMVLDRVRQNPPDPVPWPGTVPWPTVAARLVAAVYPDLDLVVSPSSAGLPAAVTAGALR